MSTFFLLSSISCHQYFKGYTCVLIQNKTGHKSLNMEASSSVLYSLCAFVMRIRLIMWVSVNLSVDIRHNFVRSVWSECGALIEKKVPCHF